VMISCILSKLCYDIVSLESLVETTLIINNCSWNQLDAKLFIGLLCIQLKSITISLSNELIL